MFKEDRDMPGGQLYIPLPGAARRPIVTYAFLGLNVVVWFATFAAGAGDDTWVLVDFGAMFGPLIAEGQYWRLFTAMFLHHDLVHLAFNGFALFIFGRLVETTYGRARFVAIYILSGLAGGVLSYALSPINIGVGASGAIFGVLGALAAFFASQRRTLGVMAQRNLMGILALATINIFYGLATPGIDNWAHLGGLVAGFALGFVLTPRYRFVTSDFGTPGFLKSVTSASRMWWTVPVALVIVTTGAWLATARFPDNAYTHLYKAERNYGQKDYDSAFAEVDSAIALDGYLAEAWLLRARILVDLGDMEGARAQLGMVIRSGDAEMVAEAIALLEELRFRP